MALCMELTVESEVCFLSSASHLQSRDFFVLQKSLRTMAQPERVNNILHSASAAKDVTLTAESFESTGMHLCVCVCVFFLPAFECECDGPRTSRVQQQVLYAPLGMVCAEIREVGPQGGYE